ncbi:MAG: YIP1 family protein [Candidatus Alcyoniella australis]|nr:YIP1 family protein [Candidatus Alcyoniella australis]
MDHQTINCPQCNALLEVGGPGRYRCPACSHEFRHPLQPTATAQEQPQVLTHGGHVYRGPDPDAPAASYEPDATQAAQPETRQPTPTVDLPPRMPEPITPQSFEYQPAPLEQRERYGLVRGALLTLWATIKDPLRFFATLDPRPGYGPALVYAIVLAGVGKLLARVFTFLQYMLMPIKGEQLDQITGMLDSLGDFGQSLAPYMTPEFIYRSNLINLAISPLLVPLGIVVWLLLSALLMHVFVNAFNPRNHGFNATLRVCCYSAGVGIAMMLPLVGPPLGFVWISTLQIIGLRQVQHISLFQALLAWMLPTMLTCCLICVF